MRCCQLRVIMRHFLIIASNKSLIIYIYIICIIPSAKEDHIFDRKLRKSHSAEPCLSSVFPVNRRKRNSDPLAGTYSVVFWTRCSRWQTWTDSEWSISLPSPPAADQDEKPRGKMSIFEIQDCELKSCSLTRSARVCRWFPDTLRRHRGSRTAESAGNSVWQGRSSARWHLTGGGVSVRFNPSISSKWFCRVWMYVLVSLNCFTWSNNNNNNNNNQRWATQIMQPLSM